MIEFLLIPLSVQTNEGVAEDLSYLDPYRTLEKKFFMVHREDLINCPKNVKRCEKCKVMFDQRDMVVIKSTGERQDYTSAKNGKPSVKTGNVYFHYMYTCLHGYDKNFVFTKVTVLKQTYERLSDNGKAVVKARGMIIEK